MKRAPHAGCCLLWLVASALSFASPSVPQDPPPADDLEGLLEGLDLQPQGEERPRPGEPRQSDSGLPGDAARPAASGQGAAAEKETPLAEAYRSMQTARALLAQGEVGEPVQAAQRRVVDLLDELIRAAEQQQTESSEATARQPSAADSAADAQQPPEASEVGTQPQEAGDEGDEPSETGDPEAMAGAAGEAGQGGEATAQATAAAGASGAARHTGQGVWGHLPERTRGMLRSELPTEYLPQYAGQISEYFRALAEMRRDD